MLAPHFVARVRDPVDFFAIAVEESDQAASAREWNILAQLEPLNGAGRHDASQDCCVTISV